MSEIIPTTESKSPISFNSSLAASIYENAEKFDLIQRAAKMFASSTMVPKEYQNNLPNCAIAINIAERLQADPFAVMQSMDVIYGRPAWRATFLIAMVNASGRYTPLQYKIEGEGDSLSCYAYAKSKETNEEVKGPLVTMAMAQAEGWTSKNGSKWLTMPQVMIQYRSASFFAKMYAPDITLGMQTREEMVDVGKAGFESAKKVGEFQLPPNPLEDAIESDIAEAEETEEVEQELVNFQKQEEEALV